MVLPARGWSRSRPPVDLGPPRRSSSMLIAASPLSAGCRVWVELRVAEFDLAAAVQEEAEDDADGISRDLGGDLVAGPVAGSGDGGEVVLGIVPGIRWGRSPFLAGDAEHQSGAVGDVGGAQVA